IHPHVGEQKRRLQLLHHRVVDLFLTQQQVADPGRELPAGPAETGLQPAPEAAFAAARVLFRFAHRPVYIRSASACPPARAAPPLRRTPPVKMCDSMASNEVRIIGGKWRGRKLVFPDHPGLRPTLGRVRETLFNWLRSDVAGSRCLDLFAGSGALGFEAA